MNVAVRLVGLNRTVIRASGVADFGKVHFQGVIAWLLWLFVHLMYLVGFGNRVIVFIRWGFQYLTFNRGARLITGGNGAHVEDPESHTEGMLR